MQSIQDDSIGTDPTIIQTIDSLDIEPEEPKSKKKSKTPNPDKKPHSILKKIIFTIFVLALMAGVAFGVYYYLSLGTGNKKTSSKKNFTLDDKVIYVGEELSNNIMDYGEFNSVDISKCILDINTVDNTTEGNYEYNVTCDKEKNTASISVIQRTVFNVETLLVYKEANSDITINEFIKSENDYTYSYVDENALNEYIQTPGGPYSIGINVKNENDEETTIYAALYVMPSKPLMYLTCNSQKQTSSVTKYTITDKIAFNSSRNNMNTSVRIYNYEFDNESEYYNYLTNINNGQINIDNHEGIVIMDNSAHILEIISTLDNNTLNQEYGSNFPTTYNEINSYYRNTKKYSCSI